MVGTSNQSVPVAWPLILDPKIIDLPFGSMVTPHPKAVTDDLFLAVGAGHDIFAVWYFDFQNLSNTCYPLVNIQKTMESGDLTNKNCDCSWDLMVVDRNYPLVNIQKTMEHHHAINRYIETINNNFQ